MLWIHVWVKEAFPTLPVLTNECLTGSLPVLLSLLDDKEKMLSLPKLSTDSGMP